MEVYGLVGNPVGHSLSPAIHEAAYDARGLDARYITLEPDPAAIGTAIDGAAALGIAGLNVTTPFKRDVLEHVATDQLADRIGAVNTIDFGTEPPRGYNTDASGATRALDRHDVTFHETDALVVGAGGAGRAIAMALDDAGARVRVANRTVAKAEDLAAGLEAGAGFGLEALPDLVPESELLVNATTVGLESDETPVPADLLHGDLVVMDAVYQPIETRLLRSAATAGAQTIDGAWMLLYQGVEAFERWTGQE
ncbi:MAG: shikimate dehydrogenase, partial [Halobacteriales archaeon]